MSVVKCFVVLGIFVFGLAYADSSLPEKEVTAKESAIKIAEGALIHKYGKKVLDERPFDANLEGNIWIVKGTLHCPQGSICKGGTARVEIEKNDGKVKSVTHDK